MIFLLLEKRGNNIKYLGVSIVMSRFKILTLSVFTIINFIQDISLCGASKRKLEGGASGGKLMIGRVLGGTYAKHNPREKVGASAGSVDQSMPVVHLPQEPAMHTPTQLAALLKRFGLEIDKLSGK